ncbi:hypothetical protein FF36_03483 [Frankia torreyi]|uniref:Uncharacterized protein n=1 Tax=Frankia torreyi TaxID=1856 RepID=A0A0D8BDV9_9ACTN|nr:MULTISPECIES: hypothetical protein [Frankia]KJE22220.1 hypothetical protein FF36_03483 [Frankia torreyi]KQC40105.1 hypothetical protein UK82_00155 [Frankia sp. ACN1ag]KQM04365.1 hypothetical protein FF86_102758 [Frankia sp. CpI1-P]
MRTSTRSRRRPFPRLAAITAAIVAVGLGVAGCDRPTPLVTMESGGDFVKTNAAQYLRDGALIQQTVSPPHLDARPGGSLNIDVPTSVADRGYFLSVNNQRITETISDTHYRYLLPNVQGTVNLVVFAAPTDPKSTTASGSWPFVVSIKP